MASLWKHPQSKYWVACYTGADGRQLKRSTRSIDKRKALEIAQAWEAGEEMSRDGYLSTKEQFRLFYTQNFERIFGEKPKLELSVRQWLEEWLKNEKGAVAVSTLERYTQIVRDFLKFLASKAELRLEALSKNDCIAYRDALLARGHTEGNANQVRKILSKPFRIAKEEGYIELNPIAGVRHLKHERIEKGVFTPEQITKLLAAADKDQEWRGMILLGFFTGGRLGDLVHLKEGNIDLLERSISFTQKKTGGKIRVPIHDELYDFLIAYPFSDRVSKPLFPRLSKLKGPGKSGLSESFKRLMGKAGIAPGIVRTKKGAAGHNISQLSFHSLRHSFTSNLANAGVSPELRQKLTGHLDDKSHGIYTHHEFATIRAALEKLGRLPKGEGEPK